VKHNDPPHMWAAFIVVLGVKVDFVHTHYAPPKKFTWFKFSDSTDGGNRYLTHPTYLNESGSIMNHVVSTLSKIITLFWAKLTQ